MKRILAVINLTYKESVRKRIFLIILFFAIALISSSAFFPVVDPAARVKLVETWAIRGISFFAMLIAILLAGVSLPDDIESKRIFILVTKPLPKESLLLGKLLGFIAVTALFIFSMALISLVYIRTVQFFTPASPRLGRDSAVASPQEYLNPRKKITAREFIFVQPDSTNDRMLGMVSGNEEITAELQGHNLNNFAVWKFQRLDKYFDLKSISEMEMELNLEAIGTDALKHYSDVAITISNPTTSTSTTRVLRAKTKQPLIIKFSPIYVDDFGQLNVEIKRAQPDSYLRIKPDNLSLTLPAGTFTFEWNFMKTMLLILLQTMLVLVITVSGSSFLSAPVNVFMAIFIYFCGSGMAFFKENLSLMEKSMEFLRRAEISRPAGQIITQMNDTMPLWMMETSKFILDIALKILPDFAVFDGMDYLLKETAVPLSLFGPALFYLAIYGLVALIIGWISLLTKQFN